MHEEADNDLKKKKKGKKEEKKERKLDEWFEWECKVGRRNVRRLLKKIVVHCSLMTAVLFVSQEGNTKMC